MKSRIEQCVPSHMFKKICYVFSTDSNKYHSDDIGVVQLSLVAQK